MHITLLPLQFLFVMSEWQQYEYSTTATVNLIRMNCLLYCFIGHDQCVRMVPMFILIISCHICVSVACIIMSHPSIGAA